MRMLNEDNNISVKCLQLLLTKSEVSEIVDSLQEILKEPTGETHVHINDSEYIHELTISIYDEEMENNKFNSRIIQLIEEDQ